LNAHFLAFGSQGIVNARAFLLPFSLRRGTSRGC
jgi:hypothetical protein